MYVMCIMDRWRGIFRVRQGCKPYHHEMILIIWLPKVRVEDGVGKTTTLSSDNFRFLTCSNLITKIKSIKHQ